MLTAVKQSALVGVSPEGHISKGRKVLCAGVPTRVLADTIDVSVHASRHTIGLLSTLVRGDESKETHISTSTGNPVVLSIAIELTVAPPVRRVKTKGGVVQLLSGPNVGMLTLGTDSELS